jgi:glycosyltransferase involved in cell wall biosynthesis
LLGRNAGYVTTQGEVLSDLFKSAGYTVISVSSQINRLRRLADIASSIISMRDRFDIVIIDVYGGLSFILEDVSSLLSLRLGKPVVMLLHGGAMPAFMSRRPRWSRRVLARADALVSPSPFLSRAVSEHGFKAKVIPNVIDFGAYPYRHRRQLSPRLFWMRQFHSIWNPVMALRSLARLRRVFPDATLVMAGPDKGQEAEVRRLAAEPGLAGAVRFTGFLDMEGKAREGSAADIFLNTNRVDNMPVAIVEACAMGLPVVATKVGGIPDLLTDNENGLLVSDDDDEEMTEAILRLLREPELAGYLSANGRRLAARSSWEQVLPQWEQVFDEVMAQPVYARSEII